jgi:hypothetical protein
MSPESIKRYSIPADKMTILVAIIILLTQYTAPGLEVIGAVKGRMDNAR